MIRKPRKKFGGALGEAFDELWEAVEAGQIVESDSMTVDKTTRGTVVRARGGVSGDAAKDIEAGDGIGVEETDNAWVVSATGSFGTASASNGVGVGKPTGRLRHSSNFNPNQEASELFAGTSAGRLLIENTNPMLTRNLTHDGAFCFAAFILATSTLSASPTLVSKSGYIAAYYPSRTNHQSVYGRTFPTELNPYRVAHFYGNAPAVNSVVPVFFNDQWSDVYESQLTTPLSGVTWLDIGATVPFFLALPELVA